MTGNQVYEIKVKKFANSEPKSLILYKNRWSGAEAGLIYGKKIRGRQSCLTVSLKPCWFVVACAQLCIFTTYLGSYSTWTILVHACLLSGRLGGCVLSNVYFSAGVLDYKRCIAILYPAILMYTLSKW